ncbi:uncharacterized protein [Montipora foliosa]|uniref:uncharacterized protein n=1 Tax=Montipora foliosa TaxID=591990 RepID=UPI0035F1FDC8
MLCENDPKCRSYNFHILTKNCELNDETKETKPNDFATDGLRFYMKREDIDKCKVFPFTCDVNTDCHKTDGSYICTCKAGYTGDGKTCTDIDECSTGKHNCSHVAVCNNTGGSYNCTCKEGYVGDGRNCSDIDECLTGKHNCSHVAVCKNTIGSYNCTCKEGYVGDGRNCSRRRRDCPEDWDANDKYCYKLLADRPTTLTDAKNRCRMFALADLPIIKSEQENIFITGLMKTQRGFFWLGMKRNGSKLFWFDRTSAEKGNNESYNAWANHEPDRAPNGGNCAYISFVRNSDVLKWYDGLCTYPKFGSVTTAPFLLCQKSRL